MNWDDIRVFVALVRFGTLSRAGRELDVEHSTVVRRIDALEKALGLRLFDRLPRGWQLTAEGEQLFVRAEQMEDCAHAFTREASEGATLSGVVRISTLPAFSAAFLTQQLALQHERWRPITLEVVGETRMANLTRREADLALRLGRPQDPSVIARPLASLDYGIYAQKNYLARTAEADWYFIGFDDSLRDAPEQQWLDNYAGARGYSFRSNNSLSLLEAAAGGVGVAVLPRFLALTKTELVQIPVSAPPPRRELWLLTHPEVRRSARVKLIADLLAEIILSSEGLLGNESSSSQNAVLNKIMQA